MANDYYTVALTLPPEHAENRDLLNEYIIELEKRLGVEKIAVRQTPRYPHVSIRKGDEVNA